MGGALTTAQKTIRLARLYGATALACLFAYAMPVTTPASAQEIGNLAPKIPAGSQMLLEADTLVYDNDKNTVTAVGGVRIDYAGNRLVAQRVTYDRNTSRLIASGNVEIIDSSGTKAFSQEIDVTDDFANGFVNALRVETVDKTYFAAESATREGGVLTTFNNGVYTACAPCEAQPDRAPIWRIKAQKIIWNGTTRTVRFERSRFEFFGFPIAYIPSFEIADPTVKRKSGFLIPSVDYKTSLGASLKVPYYFALSPTYDLTVSAGGYTKQGFLGEAEWRQRFNSGEYSLKIAGIHQNDPSAFIDNGRFGVNSGPVDHPNRFRGMIGSRGNFDINPRWAFGWDILAQTDKNFAYTYKIDSYSKFDYLSQVYLTGLNDRNYFDLRGMKFQVQEDLLYYDPLARNDKQPWVLPSFDYYYTPDEPVAGGEFNFKANSRIIHRNELDVAFFPDPWHKHHKVDEDVKRVPGIQGNDGRITGEAEWKRSLITPGGLVVTPLLAFQADANYLNASQESIDAIHNMADNLGVVADIRSSFYRAMATAGLELRWPVLFSSTSSTHILEPMAQVFARPNEPYASTLGRPNEDAQSFVFDATTLFERDKFSGYDRIEGGTRANVGFRYSGSYDNGWTTNAIFGQSYQLAGRNSFDSPDLVNAGAFSGLQNDTSDFVGLVGIASPNGLSASASARLDEQSLEIRRAELKAGYSSSPLSVAGQYAFIQRQPLYGFEFDRKEVTLGASSRFHVNWRAFGSGTYDIVSGVVTKDSLGFAYDDECFSYTLSMITKRDPQKIARDERTFGFNISFRTLGDFGTAGGTSASALP
ncbi:LPS-assembly protein [Mesorhizobium soli]|uniref:LPS-assembly protein LptD n=1 Tax=Pseudaminobacter soli (ex Li et al. 2025) TaxID=1295366 RepID=UPI00247E165E|nr:LPS-assembly protein [Mesorhizobium soli]